MAIRSGFFNSVNGDRKYNAAFFAEYFASFIGNGVFPNPSTNLQIIEGTNMTTIVKPGKGWINGYYVHNDSDLVLEHDIADGILKRIDRVVMRLNYQSRQIEIVIKKGTNASNPVPPILQRDADAYELALADVLINNGATRITQANITDTRLNSVLCGIVKGTVEEIDTTSLFNQYQSWIAQKKLEYDNDFIDWSDSKRQEFDDWMNTEQGDFQSWKTLEQSEFEAWVQSIKDILNENVAGNLQLQIDDHKADDVNHVKYAVDTGTANAKVVSINPPPESYKDGMAIAFKNAVQNTGPTTINVNGLGEVPIVKSNGQPLTADYLLPESIYTIRYNANTGNFIFQGEGGGLYGNVTPDDVLEGVVFGTDSGEKVGSMPNNGAVIITPGQNDQIIPYGFHNGQGKVRKVEFDASRVLTGTTIAGKQGTMPNQGGKIITPGISNITIPVGYHDGTSYVVGDPDLIPSNIKKGVNLFGVIGTATPESLGGRQFASGTVMSSGDEYWFRNRFVSSNQHRYPIIEVAGLDFLPKIIALRRTNDSRYQTFYCEYIHNSSCVVGAVNEIFAVDFIPSSGSNRIQLYVNSTGFRLAVGGMLNEYTWFAWS